MVSKVKLESFMVTAIKCTSILLQMILISAEYDGITLPSLNEIDQCSLCASCWPIHQGINETRTLCTDTAAVPNLKYECWRNGDYSELIYHDGKKSDISLIPPSEEKGICYFNVSYYDFSKARFVEDDTVFLDYRENKKIESLHGKWKVIDGETDAKFKFRVLALTGR